MPTVHAKLTARLADNRLCAELMSRKDLELERKLHQSKWFDYRFVSPMDATHQFRTAYSEIYQRKYARNISTDDAKPRNGVRAGPAFQTKTELTSFWRARQTADLYGLPYKVFIEVAFDQLLGGGWQRMPHPNQLYAKRNLQRICIAAAVYWKEFQQSLFDRSFSHLPEYRTESYHHFPAQIAHRAWVIDLLKEKPIAWAIGRAWLINRVISPELALAEFEDEKVASAREYAAEITPEPLDPLKVREILPSCLGLPGALVPTSSECLACPAIGLCVRMQALTLGGLKRTTGSENPEHERRKKQQRDRAQRHRAKKALAAGVPSDAAEPASSAGSV
jgi:hypothetical protein